MSKRKPAHFAPALPVPRTLQAVRLDDALGMQRILLYRVAGIMACATRVMREEPTEAQIQSAWAALDAAHALLMDSIETGLQGDAVLAEVAHG